MKDRFVKIRAGIIEHQKDGRLKPAERLALMDIILLADCASGLWMGSSHALAGKSGIPQRTAVELLHSLTEKGYISRWQWDGHSRGNHLIAVNKYEVTMGPNAGKRLDLVASVEADSLIYAAPAPSATNAEPKPKKGVVKQTQPIHESAEDVARLFVKDSEPASQDSIIVLSEFLHGQDAEEIEAAIEWGLKLPFWKKRITGPEKFIQFWSKEGERCFRDQFFKHVNDEFRKLSRTQNAA